MNEHAKDIYQGYYRKLSSLMNRHWQISQVSPESVELPTLAAEIRRVAAVCETWKNIAAHNARSKYYQQGY